jgi:hypothetical protein
MDTGLGDQLWKHLLIEERGNCIRGHVGSTALVTNVRIRGNTGQFQQLTKRWAVKVANAISVQTLLSFQC